jgi:hypothetical protein
MKAVMQSRLAFATYRGAGAHLHPRRNKKLVSAEPCKGTGTADVTLCQGELTRDA